MDAARRLAVTGQTYVLHFKGDGEKRSGIYVFYNNPLPFCYTYMIPGEWVRSPGQDGYRSQDGRAFVGVWFLLAESLVGVEGATLLERLRNDVTASYEKQLGQRLAGVELLPFESGRPGTWRWTAAPVSVKQRGTLKFPVKILVDLGSEAIAHITVIGTADDQDLARRVVETFRTTSDTACYLPVLETMLRSMRPE